VIISGQVMTIIILGGEMFHNAPTSRYWCGENYTSSVDGLKHAFEMTLPRDLFNQDGRQSFRTQLLMDTKIVDLSNAK
jgi:hypothetical protein